MYMLIQKSPGPHMRLHFSLEHKKVQDSRHVAYAWTHAEIYGSVYHVLPCEHSNETHLVNERSPRHITIIRVAQYMYNTWQNVNSYVCVTHGEILVRSMCHTWETVKSFRCVAHVYSTHANLTRCFILSYSHKINHLMFIIFMVYSSALWIWSPELTWSIFGPL